MYPNLRAELARSGLTLVELGRLIEMPYSTLYQKYHGRSEFTYSETVKIKQALKVEMPLEYLFSEVV